MRQENKRFNVMASQNLDQTYGFTSHKTESEILINLISWTAIPGGLH